jgi:HK97 family phage portal protein
MWPLLPDRTWPERDRLTRSIVYKTIGDNGQTTTLPASSVFHVKGLGFDGLVGYSVIRMARESMGLALAAEEFGARFFANGVRPSGVLESPDELGDNAYERLQKAIDAHRGLENQHKMLILEQGTKWTKTSMTANEAQFLESRQFTVPEICRWYRMQPHIIGDLSRATFSNIEHQSIEFVVFTLRPWLVRVEQELARRLMIASERDDGYYFAFNVRGLLRGDIASRYAAYAIGRQWGWLSADDVLALEDSNPLPDGKGAVYLNPMNMIEAGKFPEPTKREAPHGNGIAEA